MYKYYPQPAIIGSGLTGLLISLELSKARIGHLLIGGPPPVGGPRLGESLNIEATIYFLAEYPELADCYYTKQFAVTHGGEISGFFDFSFIASPQSAVMLRSFGKAAPKSLIHFDRERLDAALYEKAINNPYCTHIDARVTQLLCAPDSDHIQQIVLEDDTALPVSHVFDTTGHIRLVARQLNIPRQILGPTQHVVFTHYYRQASAPPLQANDEWQHGTNIVRLYEERDGLNGIAWCIPLGNTISVGVTTPMMDGLPTDDALLQLTQQAFAIYDVNYPDVVQEQSRVGRARMEFYTHARTHGANWLLTGAAHTQVWWPTSAGLDTSVTAAQIAARFVRNPQRMGTLYQQYLVPLVQSQALWNWATTHPYGALTEETGSKFANRLFWSIGNRFFKSLTLEERDPLNQMATALTAHFFDHDRWSQIAAPVEIRRYK